jgi:minimal PKS acyl carrier protein
MTSRAFSLNDLVQMLTRAAGFTPEAGEVDEQLALGEAGIDSLAFLQLRAELADRYAVELPEEWHAERTFGEIVALVNASPRAEATA